MPDMPICWLRTWTDAWGSDAPASWGERSEPLACRKARGSSLQGPVSSRLGRLGLRRLLVGAGLAPPTPAATTATRAGRSWRERR